MPDIVESVAGPPPKSFIFWDWDDTLLCSSFLSCEGYKLDSDITNAPDLLRQLKSLEVSVIRVLETSMTKGEVVIITNAENGWVQLSAQKFVPGVLPLLEKITVVSARSSFEYMFPDAPLKWKYCAFQERLGEILQRTEVEKHIISFGDSHVEREAIRAVTKDCHNTKTKSIKFAERPTIEQLQRQVELATDCFQYIHGHEGDLDLCMSLSMVPSNQAQQQQQQQAQHPDQHNQSANYPEKSSENQDPNLNSEHEHKGDVCPKSPTRCSDGDRSPKSRSSSVSREGYAAS